MIQEQDIRDAIKAAGVDVDPNKIPIDKPLKDAGLDSLDRFNTFLELEKYVGREISDEEIENLQTIQAILDYVNNGQ
jgi:acyl carrier protein